MWFMRLYFYCTYHIQPIQITHQNDTTHNFSRFPTLNSWRKSKHDFTAFHSVDVSCQLSREREKDSNSQHKVFFLSCNAATTIGYIGAEGKEENVVKSTLLSLIVRWLKSVEINDLVSNHQILTLMFILQIVRSPFKKFFNYRMEWREHKKEREKQTIEEIIVENEVVSYWTWATIDVHNSRFYVKTKRVIWNQMLLQTVIISECFNRISNIKAGESNCGLTRKFPVHFHHCPFEVYTCTHLFTKLISISTQHENQHQIAIVTSQ